MNIKFCHIYRYGEAGGKQAEEPSYQEDLQRRIRLYQRLSLLLLLVTLILAAAIIALSFQLQAKPDCLKIDVDPDTYCSQERCNELHPRVEKTVKVLTEKKSECQQGCSDGWVKFGNSCFFFSQIRNTWHGSREQCQKWGADLAVIDNDQVQEFLCRKGTLMFWFGLSRSGTGKWEWVNQSGLGRSYWSAGADKERCGFLTSGGDPQKSWNSADCSSLTAYICQKKA